MNPDRKHSLSRQHFRASRYFALEAAALEDENGSESKLGILVAHRAYITGAIMAAIAGIEASINELFHEAADSGQASLEGLSTSETDLLAEWWEEVDRVSVLREYQTALLLCGRQKFDRGGAPYQDAESAVQLRNALVHYRPEWESEQDRHIALEQRLRKRFDLNPLTAQRSLWFPHRCLSSDCASWVLKACTVFLLEFCSRLGIPSRCDSS